MPSHEDSMRMRRSNGENARSYSISSDMKTNGGDDHRRIGGGEERATMSYDGRREGERNSEEFSREAGENGESLFTRKLPAEKQEEGQIPATFDAEAAVKKLSQTKEYFAELCRHYLAHYKTQGADVSFLLPPTGTDRRCKCPDEETLEAGRNGAREGVTPSFSARGEELSDLERNAGRRTASFSAATRPSNIHYKPPAECRRLPSNFDYFLTRDILRLEFDPSNACYREELLALESRVLQMLDSLHHRDEQLVEIDPRSHECDKTILCKARENKTGASELSQFRSYQFAFKAAAVAEIVRLRSDLIKSKSEVVELLSDTTMGKGFSGARAQSELVKRLKLENEVAAAELAQLRAEKIVTDEWFPEIQYLRGQLASCTCKHVGQRVGVATTNAAGYELKRPASDVSEQRQQDGHDIVSPRAKVMRGGHVGILSEDEVLLEGICEVSVEREVFRLIVKKLDAVKADMAVFVKTLQSRVASVAGKINVTESRVRPVKVGLFCLKLLIDKLQAKRAEIEASLVENSLENAPSMFDNRLGLKLHFRS